jgi:hypothetical protein
MDTTHRNSISGGRISARRTPAWGPGIKLRPAPVLFTCLYVFVCLTPHQAFAAGLSRPAHGVGRTGAGPQPPPQGSFVRTEHELKSEVLSIRWRPPLPNTRCSVPFTAGPPEQLQPVAVLPLMCTDFLNFGRMAWTLAAISCCFCCSVMR